MQELERFKNRLKTLTILLEDYKDKRITETNIRILLKIDTEIARTKKEIDKAKEEMASFIHTN